MHYETTCNKMGNQYRIILKQSGNVNSDMLVLNKAEVISLIECAIKAKKGVDDGLSLYKGDMFTFVKQPHNSTFLLSVVTGPKFCKGYSFDLPKLKLFISELTRLLAE